MPLLPILSALALQNAIPSVAPPIIDMHMHAWSLEEFGGSPPPGCMGARGIDMHGIDPAKPFDFMSQSTCKVTVEAPKTDKALLDDTIAQMQRFNIVSGVISGERAIVAKWMTAAPAGSSLPRTSSTVPAFPRRAGQRCWNNRSRAARRRSLRR